MSGRVFGVGIVGVGKVSEQYLARIPVLDDVRLVSVTDANEERAASVAAAAGVEALPFAEVLQHPDVDIVLDLTIPASHVEIATAALSAGKHVYGEKPIALRAADGAGLVSLAAKRGLRLGSAPDTVLGTGVQTAWAAVRDGRIGEVVGAAAAWSAPGHELWHPAPSFYYQPGAGPLMDMGPYYLTTLVLMLGPVRRVTGFAHSSGRARRIATGPHAGEEILQDAGVPTHVTAVLEHEDGATSSVLMSFEVWGSRLPHIEVYGTAGTIAVPDPNEFSGDVSVYPASTRAWEHVEASAGYADAGRGFGLADMAHAIATGRPHRATGAMAAHVLECMEAIIAAAADGIVVEVASRPPMPSPVPFGAVLSQTAAP